MKCSVIGLGTALPPETVLQQEAYELSKDVLCADRRQERWLRVLFQNAGVDQRHTVIPWRTGYEWARSSNPSAANPPEEHALPSAGPSTAERMRLYAQYAPPLAIAACQSALTDAAVDANEVTHLVTVSCTGFAAPGIDFQLIEQLGLPDSTERLNVAYMGCHGAINGLRAARGLVASNPGAKVLVCAVELCSLHYRMRWDDEAIVGNALFSDGAAAAVLTSDEASADAPVLVDTFSTWLPNTRSQMSWNVGEHGFEMRLSSEIPDSILSHLRQAIDPWLSRHGLTRRDIADWVVHPGGPRILDAVQQSLQLTDCQLSDSREVLRTCGNMSSPTVLFILQRALARQTQMLGKLQPIKSERRPRVVLGFGPGLVIETALLR